MPRKTAGVLELDSITSLATQMATLSQQLGKMNVNAIQTNVVCDHCVADTLPTRTSASSSRGDLLGALCVADDGMRNEGAWAALSQSLGFMFSQHTHGSSCLTSNAPKGSLRETSAVSLLKLDQ